MSAYILPNSILLLAIVSAILLIARHFPEATRQLEEPGGTNTDSARDVFKKRWIPLARGGLRSFWRFVLEGKGLRDPKASKFRMRQLLEQNRLPKGKVVIKSKIAGYHNAQAKIAPITIPAEAEVRIESEQGQAIHADAVQQSMEVETPALIAPASEEVVVPAQPRKPQARRKPVVPRTDPDEVMQQAKKFIDAKEFLRARYELEQVTESFQEDPLFWARLGYVQYHLGAYREAVRCYQKSLGLDSNQANRYYNLALAHEAAQERAESLAALNQALVLDPGNLKYRQTLEALKTI